MGSPITLSGFNDIDFNVILNAIMEQERVPLLILERQQSSLNSQSGAFGNLATRLGALETAVDDLDDSTAFGQRSVTNTDITAVSVTPTESTPVGTYDIVVNELARASVLATDSTHADKDTTVVASGGSLTIGATAVNITGDVTLEGLRDAINSTSGVGVTASIVTPAAGSYQLVVTGNDTGAANAFTITNALTGGAAPVTFDDFDTDGISGDDASDYKVIATDALATINNIAVSSSTNVLEDAIPGATVTLIKKDPLATVTPSESTRTPRPRRPGSRRSSTHTTGWSTSSTAKSCRLRLATPAASVATASFDRSVPRSPPRSPASSRSAAPTRPWPKSESGSSRTADSVSTRQRSPLPSTPARPTSKSCSWAAEEPTACSRCWRAPSRATRRAGG